MRGAPAFDHSDVEVLSDEPAWAGFFKVKILRLRHKLFGGGWSGDVSRELFCRDPAVGVLLYDPATDSVALQQQFRPGAIDDSHTPWVLETVAGIVEPGESTEDVALRECVEEAGVTPRRLIPICEYLPSPGGSNERITAYCGIADLSGVGGVFGLASENEDILVQVYPRQAAIDLLGAGDIRNALTIISLQWLQLNLSELRKGEAA